MKHTNNGGILVEIFCTGIMVLAMIVFTARYVLLTYRRNIQPTLQTWGTFMMATFFSLVTYASSIPLDKMTDELSGSLNVIDFLVSGIIFIAISFWGEEKEETDRFQMFYAEIICWVFMYSVLTGNLFRSNIFTQILMSMGYIPTVMNMIRKQKNTESYASWFCVLIAGGCALYPSLQERDLLASIYASRSVAFTLLILGTMRYYDRHQTLE